MGVADRTSILAAVYGPREVPARKEIQGKCVIEVVVRPRSGVPGRVVTFCRVPSLLARLFVHHAFEHALQCTLLFRNPLHTM